MIYPINRTPVKNGQFTVTIPSANMKNIYVKCIFTKDGNWINKVIGNKNHDLNLRKAIFNGKFATIQTKKKKYKGKPINFNFKTTEKNINGEVFCSCKSKKANNNFAPYGNVFVIDIA